MSTKSQNALQMLMCTALQAISKFKPLYPCLGTISLISFQVPYSPFSSFHLIHHGSFSLFFIIWPSFPRLDHVQWPVMEGTKKICPDNS